MSSIPAAQGDINLGTTFYVTFRVPIMREIARELNNIRNQARRLGAVLDGPWQEAIQFFDSFSRRLGISEERANRQVAAMYFEDVRSAWNSQSLAPGFAPLNIGYVAQKVAQGLDRRVLIATKDALNSMGFNMLPGITVEIGVTATTPNGEPYMMNQEFGSISRRIPARPMFGRILSRMIRRYIGVYVNAVKAVLTGGLYPDYAAGALA
jgi:hypothetical protein